jgi:hypothetical protein
MGCGLSVEGIAIRVLSFSKVPNTLVVLSKF